MLHRCALFAQSDLLSHRNLRIRILKKVLLFADPQNQVWTGLQGSLLFSGSKNEDWRRTNRCKICAVARRIGSAQITIAASARIHN